MSAPKTVNVFGLLAKTPETGSVYGAGASVAAATDGVLLAQESVMRIDYADRGQRPTQPGGTGVMRRAPPTGRTVTFPVRQEVRGSGAAYSASVFPLNGLHTMLQIAGHSATGSFGGGTEKWTYAPITAVGAYVSSAGMEAYSRGQKWPLISCYSDLSFDISGPGITFFNFPTSAVLTTDPTDVAKPAITFNTTLIPPKATSMAVTLGNFTAGKVRSITGSMNRTLSGRNDINGTGHSGWTPGDRRFELKVVVESPTLTTSSPWTGAATLNAYELMDSGQSFVSSFTVGSVQYNRWKFNAPQAYLVDVEDGNDGASAIWTLTIECCVSSPELDDDYTLVFD